MTKEDEEDACCEIYQNAHSWVLKNITPIELKPVKGQLSFFMVEI